MTSVMIVQELDLLRGAVAAVLAHEPDLDVTSQLSPADDVAAAARTARPDVILIHLAQCDEAALALPRQLHADLPDTAILLVAGRHTPEALRDVVDAGISGFLDADTKPPVLVDAVRRLAAGERVIDPLLVVAALRGEDDNPLTPRQREVLGLAAEGLDARSIGRQLFLSPGTVRNYLSAAIKRTGAGHLLEAAERARKEGWL